MSIRFMDSTIKTTDNRKGTKTAFSTPTIDTGPAKIPHIKETVSSGDTQ